jgi:hypothetical protein
MAFRRRSRVVDRDGVVGKLLDVSAHDHDRPLARVQLDHGTSVLVPFELLRHHESGGYYLPAHWQDFTKREADGGLSIPIIEERVVTGVRPAPERRFRIRRRVVSEAKHVEVPYMHESFDVQRVPIGQFVDRAPAPRQEGDVLIVPCIEEVVVVEKRLRVREELRIRIVREQRTHRQTVQVRRHELDTKAPDEPVAAISNKPKGDAS